MLVELSVDVDDGVVATAEIATPDNVGVEDVVVRVVVEDVLVSVVVEDVLVRVVLDDRADTMLKF